MILRQSDRHGYDPAHSSLPGNCAGRVSVLVRRPRRRVRLHRDDDFVWAHDDRDSANRARAEYFGRDDRLISILARRTLFLETILAIRPALGPGGLLRRLPSTICFDSSNLDRHRTPFFSDTII